MIEGPSNFDPHASPSTGTSLVPANLSRGSSVSIWVLWLLIGLPASALVFVLVPGYIALHASEWLEAAEVPLEAWTELEPWIGLALLAAAVHHQASFRHRRPAMSEGSRTTVGQMWLTAGGLATLAWLGLLGLENLPQTKILPELHYIALSSTMVWLGLSLAWLSGCGVSLILVGVERRAAVSQGFRGGLYTAAPATVLLVAVAGGSLGLDANERVDEARTLIEDSFEDDWSVLADAGSERPRALSPAPSKTRAERFNACIEQLYKNGKGSIYWRGVKAIRGYPHVDGESVASETAISVCSRPEPPEDLRSYYLKSVKNRARTDYSRTKRFGTCSFELRDREYRMPTGETMEDCVYEQLCKLDDPDRHLMFGLLDGLTASEFAERERISQEAAQKRRTRAKRRFISVVRRECMTD